MKRRSAAVDYALIVVCALLMGVAIKNIYDPANMVTGGVSGVAIIAKELWGAPLWLTRPQETQLSSELRWEYWLTCPVT